jgi:ribosomal protein L11 methyltransferase
VTTTPAPPPEPPRYPYVAVDVSEEEADEAGALLFELGAGGVERRDATTLARGATGKVTLVASFERHEDARAAIAELPGEWAPRVDEVVGDAWRDEWKKHFEPFRVCAGVVVRPPWREHAAAPGEHVVILEPGRAFGTGLHETTNLVAETLAETPLAGATVLDVGCGSGILTLVALALGAASARAVDVDPEAVAVTRENADRNGARDRVEADETPVEALSGRYPVVLANIEHRTLVELAPALIARVAPGGLLVLSGILAPAVAPAQLEDIRRAFAALKEERVRARGEWIAVSLRG